MVPVYIWGIIEGTTLEFLQSVKSKKGAGVYLSDLIEHNIRKQNLPTSNLKTFNYSMESKTIDPFLPMLKVADGIPKVNAIALLKDDKYVDSIPMKKAFVFNVLYEKMRNGDYTLKTKEYKASIQNVDSKRDIIVKRTNRTIRVNINVQIHGVVRELAGKEKLNNKAKLKKDLEKNIKKQADKLIAHFQELNIDPLGIQEKIRASVRNMSVKKINDLYPTLPITTKVTYTNVESGTRK